MDNGNTPASPTTGEISNADEVWSYQVGDHNRFQFVGFTKREQLAAMMMQGLLSNCGGPIQSSNTCGFDWCNTDINGVAQLAVACADALLNSLERLK